MTIRTLQWAVGTAMLAAVAVQPASSQPYDRNTTFTFNVPVAVPGVTLPAGAYRFRLAIAPAQNVVQVLSADGRASYAMFFALSTERAHPIDHADVEFLETGRDVPPAIKTWWYPGTTGYEFIYPREQRQRLLGDTPSPAR